MERATPYVLALLVTLSAGLSTASFDLETMSSWDGLAASSWEKVLSAAYARWHPGQDIPQADVDAIHAAAKFLEDRVANADHLEVAPSLTQPCVGPASILIQHTCIIQPGDTLSWNRGPAEVELGVALGNPCNFVSTPLTYSQFEPDNAVVHVPAGENLWLSEPFPEFRSHEDGLHLGGACIVTNGPGFSLVSGTGIFWYEK